MKGIIGHLFVVLALTACASGPAFQEAPPPASGKAILYLMRPTVGGGSFWNTKFSVNGAEVVSLSNGGYSWLSLDAGTYEISTQHLRSRPLRIRIVMPPGGTRYVEMRQGETINAGTGERQDLLIALPSTRARPVLKKLKYTMATTTAVTAPPTPHDPG